MKHLLTLLSESFYNNDFYTIIKPNTAW